MLFTTGQLRSAFNLSKQQWRSYRETLLPLAKDQGRSACFTAGDLLATSVVCRACASLSIPVSVFAMVATPLFELCGTRPWPQLERSNLLIDLEENQVELFDGERRAATGGGISLLIQLGPLIADIRRHLLADAPDPQRDLAFPPMIAGARR